MPLQTREFTGSTGSTYWTWKIKVIEDNYLENGIVSTNKVNITIEEYLGRKKGSEDSFFDGKATLKFIAGTQSKSKSFSGGASVKDGAWYKIGTHTFEGVDNNGTLENPTQLSVSGSLVDASFSPKTAKASGILSLTPLHTPPVINNVSILETNQKMITLGVPNDTLVQFLSQKKFTIDTTTYDDATVTNYSIYHNNVLIGTSTTNEINVNFNNVSELMDSGTGYVGLSVAITDSLGGNTTRIFNYPVIKYTRPSIETTSTTIKRKTGNGTVLTDNIATLNFVGTCYKGNDVIGNENIPKVEYKIWNTTEPEYIALSTPNTANIKIENHDIQNILYTSVYEYKVKLSDSFNTIEDNTKKVPTGQSVWSEYKDRVDFLKITEKKKEVVKAIKFIEGEEYETGYSLGDKKIYCRLYTGTMPNTAGSNVELQSLDFEFTECWIAENLSFISKENETLQMNFYYGSNDYLRTWVNKENSHIRIRQGSDYSNYNYNIVVFYTKN